MLNTQFFSFNSFQIEVDDISGKIYVCRDTSVDVYNSSATVVNCPNFCATCLEPNSCKVCESGYILEDYECKWDPAAKNNLTITNGTSPINNNATTENNSLPASPNNHPTANLSSNDTDQSYLILVMPDGSVRIF